MKKTILFLAAFLLSAGSLAAQTSAEGVRNVIYLIGDGMGLAQVSMLKIENGYEPTAFDRAEGVALISTYSANNRVTDSAAAVRRWRSGRKDEQQRAGARSRRECAAFDDGARRGAGYGHGTGRGDLPAACDTRGVLRACWKPRGDGGHHARHAFVGDRRDAGRRLAESAKALRRGRNLCRGVRPARIPGRAVARRGRGGLVRGGCFAPWTRRSSTDSRSPSGAISCRARRARRWNCSKGLPASAAGDSC